MRMTIATLEHRMNGATALVTGGTGFIGQHLVRALLARGASVRVLARPQPSATSTAARQALIAAGAQLVQAHLSDRQVLDQALHGTTHVFHLAGQLHAPGIAHERYTQLHVIGTRLLLDACVGVASLRAFVHCSTTGVLGPTGPKPRDEAAPPRPSNSYEATKALGEQLALQAGTQGIPVVIARPALVYGPGDLHLLGWFRAIRYGYYRVVGSGESLLHPIFIDDLVAGLLRCIDHPDAGGRVYHLVGEHALSIQALASAIAAALGRTLPQLHLPLAAAQMLALLEAVPGLPPWALPLTRDRIAFMTSSRAYCGCRARRELGFRPGVDLDSGLRQTVAWYRAEGLL